MVTAVPSTPRAEDRAAGTPQDAPRSPWQGIIDGNGQAIPCRCRFGGQSYAIGDTVCMSTHVGVVLTRCGFVLNNTSWIPTETPCRATSEAIPGRDPSSGPARRMAQR
jgi:hypothetical protein